MSEFSESYHLRTTNKGDGKELLKRIGVKGMVFPETNGWVTILPKGEFDSQTEKMVAAYDGTMLHYMLAEDHVWLASLFISGERVSHYVCAWDPEFHIESGALNVGELTKFLLDKDNREAFKRLFEPADFNDVFENNPAYHFAEWLGIKHYQWMSGEGLERYGNELLENYPEAEIVD